jgi:hypothetical protein
MFDLTSRKIMVVSPTLAARWLESNTFPAQRRLRPGHVRVLAEKMKCGRFRTGEVAFVANGDGREVLVNGQHQLNAIIEAQTQISCLVERFHCPTPADRADCFRQFDVGLSRSLPDMVRVEAAALGLSWPDRVCQVVVSGCALNQPTETATGHRWDKVELLRPNLEFGHFFADLIAAVPDGAHACHYLLRAPVVAAMNRTWEKDPDDALLFWGQVRDGEMLTRRMPSFHLRQFLLEFRVRWTGSHGHICTDHEFIYRCISAWNSFRSERELKGSPNYSPKRPVPKCR